MGWFKRNRTSSRAASEPPLGSKSRNGSATEFAELLKSAADGDSQIAPRPSEDQDQSSLRPIQFQAARHTLFISPSEEELYLTALSGLEPSIPALPLWSEPSPALPDVPLDQAPIPVPHVPYPKTPSPPPLRPHRGHGILSLIGDGVVKLAGFPAIVVHEVHQALQTWRYGVARHKYIDRDIAIVDDDQGVEWKAELGGKVWRLKGSQELESIRLLLTIFTALGKHGYTMRGPIQPAMAKPDSHSFLFAYSHAVESCPPLFFAVTIPLPDRISVVSPPPSVDNHIIGAVRNAITGVDGSRSMTLPSPSKTIKMEGWVTAGVFRFWVGGLRRWPGGGVKREVVAQVQPEVVLAIINGLAAQRFDFVGSVPFLPLTAGRDVLLFASRRETGLCWRDAFVDPADLPPSDSATSTVVPSNVIANGKSTPSSMRANGLSLDMTGDNGAWMASRVDNTRHLAQHRRRSFPRGASQTTIDTSMSQPFFRSASGGTNYNERSFSRPRARTSFDRQSSPSKDTSAAPSLRAVDTAPSPPPVLAVNLPQTVPIVHPEPSSNCVYEQPSSNQVPPEPRSNRTSTELPPPTPSFHAWAFRRPRSNEMAKPAPKPKYHKRAASIAALGPNPPPTLAELARSPPSPSPSPTPRFPSPPFRKSHNSSPSMPSPDFNWGANRTPQGTPKLQATGDARSVPAARTSYQLFEPLRNDSGTFGLYPGAAPLSRTPSPVLSPLPGRASAVAPDQPELSMAGSYPTLPGIPARPAPLTHVLQMPFIPSGAASESEYSESTTQAPDLERIDSDTYLLDTGDEVSPRHPIRSPTDSEISSQAVFVTPPSTPPPTTAGGFAPHNEYRANLPSPSAAAKRSPPKSSGADHRESSVAADPATVLRAVAAQAAPATLLRPAAGARATIVPAPVTARSVIGEGRDGPLYIPRRSSRRGSSPTKVRPPEATPEHIHSENVRRIVSDRATMLSRASMVSNGSGTSVTSSRRVGSSRTRLSMTPKAAVP